MACASLEPVDVRITLSFSLVGATRLRLGEGDSSRDSVGIDVAAAVCSACSQNCSNASGDRIRQSVERTARESLTARVNIKSGHWRYSDKQLTSPSTSSRMTNSIAVLKDRSSLR